MPDDDSQWVRYFRLPGILSTPDKIRDRTDRDPDIVSLLAGVGLSLRLLVYEKVQEDTYLNQLAG